MKVCGALIFIFLSGCTLAQIDVEVLSERTTLENQVLGTYNALDRQMLLAASVRAVDASGQLNPPPAHSPEHNDAVGALQVIEFHADDLQIFKQLGWVGENNRGLLEAFARDGDRVPEKLRAFAERYSDGEFAAVVNQINRARQVIMTRVIALNTGLTHDDLPEIQEIFAKLNAAKALTGERLQLPDGSWTEKP